ncbi:Sec-independent protein translocase subunit TatA/TatB [Lacipirellula sp.]|uniref:Sec-independent protein translocase subunit TatA/TatB n=1 Tax=Lacipirellula sp. TaxID=2691419 RepID=UPI003D115ACE
MLLPLAFLNFGIGEMALLAIVALLLYGSDLPEVARTWGKAYQEFRRNLNGFRTDLNNVIYSEPETSAPRKLQYYPEFHNDSTEADASRDDAAESGVEGLPAPATESAVPVASTPATGTKLATPPADAEPARTDAHGAA